MFQTTNQFLYFSHGKIMVSHENHSTPRWALGPGLIVVSVVPLRSCRRPRPPRPVGKLRVCTLYNNYR